MPVLTLAGFLALRPDLYVVERVVFEGAERASATSLRHLADVPNGTTVWGVDLERATAGVSQHPWVRSAKAELEWPATVRVSVQEHRPVALLAGKTMQYVCDEGLPIVAATSQDLDYPVITGVTEELGQLHPELPHRVVLAALELMRAVSDVGVLPVERVGEVNFSATRGFTVHVAGGARVIFDLEDFDRQARRLARLVDEGVSLDHPVYIDLAPATMAIVRPLEDLDVEG